MSHMALPIRLLDGMDSDNPGSNIFEVSELCSELFKEYLANPSSTRKDAVEDLRSRFHLWTAYTGAFAPAGTSLDDRLEFQDDVKRMVVKLLYMIQRNLQSVIRSDQDYNDRLASSRPENLSTSSDTSVLPTISFCGLEAVSAALDRLHKLAIAVRRSSVDSRKDKLLINIRATEEDLCFESCIYHFLRDRFPVARASLLNHLTAAMSFLRKRLLYQPKHNKKLANKPKQPNLPTSVAARKFTPTVAMSKTDASIPISQLIRRSLLKHPKSTVSVASVGSATQCEVFYYPDLPPLSSDEKYCPCPYCAEPLPASKLHIGKRTNVDFWRGHLNGDLEPYFCISEECREPLQFFVRFQDWFEHMNSSHTADWSRSLYTTTWVCQMCHGQTQSFYEKAEFELHIQASHGNLTTAQKIARMKRSKTKILREQLACPLCECVPPMLAAIDFQRQAEEARAVLGKHIGSHIKALSLLSFRFTSSSIEGDSVSETSSNAARHRSTDIRQQHPRSEPDETLSISFGRWDTSDHSHFIDSNSDGRINQDDSSLQTPEIPDPGSWNFLPGFQHLGDKQAAASSWATSSPSSEDEQTIWDVMVKVDGRVKYLCTALPRTDSISSLVSESTASRAVDLELATIRPSNFKSLKLIGNRKRIPVLGEMRLKFFINDVPYRHTFLVVEVDEFDMMLGAQFLERSGLQVRKRRTVL